MVLNHTEHSLLRKIKAGTMIIVNGHITDCIRLVESENYKKGEFYKIMSLGFFGKLSALLG
jgi:hypothetical protein